MKETNNVSKWFVGLSVLLVVVGIVIVVWPNLTIDLLGIMTGIILLVVGLVYVIMYFTKDHMGEVMQMDLTMGAVLAAFGAFMLMHKPFVSMALPFAAGIVLLIGGITKIQHALDMKRLNFLRWQIMLGLAIAMIILSVILLYNPFKERALIYVMGAGMIVNGAASIVAILMISHRLKMMARGAVYTGSADRLIVDHKAAEAKKEKEKKGGLFGLFRKKEKHAEPDAGATEAPSYDASVHEASDYEAPTYEAPVYDAPAHDASVHEAADYEPQESNEGFTAGFGGGNVSNEAGSMGDDAAGEETGGMSDDAAQEETGAGQPFRTGESEQTVEDPFDLG